MGHVACSAQACVAMAMYRGGGYRSTGGILIPRAAWAVYGRGQFAYLG